MGVSDGVETQD